MAASMAFNKDRTGKYIKHTVRRSYKKCGERVIYRLGEGWKGGYSTACNNIMLMGSHRIKKAS